MDKRGEIKSNFAEESRQRLAGAHEMYRKLQVEVCEHMKLKERLIRRFAIDWTRQRWVFFFMSCLGICGEVYLAACSR